MSKENTLYVISNGSTKFYSNTLTNFSNKMPIPLDITKHYEIGIQSVGFWCQFQNVFTAPKTFPSLFITDCKASKQERTHACEDSIEGLCETLINWDDASRPVCRKGTCSPPCRIWSFYLEDKTYTTNDVLQFCQDINSKTGVLVDFIDGKLRFRVPNKDKSFWVMFHPTFMRTFNFAPYRIATKEIDALSRMHSIFIKAVTIGDVKFIQRIINYRGQPYYGYVIEWEQNGGEIEKFLLSERKDLNKNAIPKTIHIGSDNIQAQILNSNYSQCLLVFSPNISKEEKYLFKEIDTVDYVPLLNSVLSHINIKLLDSNDEELHLIPGPATIVKLLLREMLPNKESFNITLTSEKSKQYIENKSNSFKVKLPNTLHLDSSKWRVCLNSISFPTIFSTFPNNEKQRRFGWISPHLSFRAMHLFKANYRYTESEITGELDSFLKVNGIGSCALQDNKIVFSIKKRGRMITDSFVSKILGIAPTVERTTRSYITDFMNIPDTLFERSPTGLYVKSLVHSISLDYSQPNYLMVYSNIVRPVVIGGEYKKILRVVPIVKSELEFTTEYFKHKEFCKLENNHIDTIDVILASHDGELINFKDGHDVIINLEFSTHFE